MKIKSSIIFTSLLISHGSIARAGAESSGSTEPIPYIPTTPFQYNCNLAIEGVDTHGPFTEMRLWRSETKLVINNAKTQFYANEIPKWTHFYRDITYGKGEPFQVTAKLPPYSLNVALAMGFTQTPPEPLITVQLSLSSPEIKVPWQQSSSAYVYGDFLRDTLRGKIDVSLFDRRSSHLKNVEFFARCEPVR